MNFIKPIAGIVLFIVPCVAPFLIGVLPVEFFIRRYKPTVLPARYVLYYSLLYVLGGGMTIWLLGDIGPIILGLMLIWLVIFAVGLTSLSRTVKRVKKNALV